MRDLSWTREIMSARSVNVEPITLPEPAIVSRRGIIEVVAACAAFRWEAMRAMAAGRGDGPVEPGLEERHGKVGVSGCYFVIFLYDLGNWKKCGRATKESGNGWREGPGRFTGNYKI